jgi:hypothetical protein
MSSGLQVKYPSYLVLSILNSEETQTERQTENNCICRHTFAYNALSLQQNSNIPFMLIIIYIVNKYLTRAKRN